MSETAIETWPPVLQNLSWWIGLSPKEPSNPDPPVKIPSPTYRVGRAGHRGAAEWLADRLPEIVREPFDQNLEVNLKCRHWRDRETASGLRSAIEVRDLSRAGWGLVFAADDRKAPAIRSALEPLLTHRRQQVTRRRRALFTEYEISFTGDRNGEWRLITSSGREVEPGSLPYYLLLIGSPEKIPYGFQHQLSLHHGVGRLSFAAVADYRHYALSVVAAERKGIGRRTAAFFGPENSGDPLSERSCRGLVAPLASEVAHRGQWQVESILGKGASKDRLTSLLGGRDTPGILFTAGHGVASPEREDYRDKQGALVCSGWRGPGYGERPGDCFGASDIPEDADLQGLISINFACFSAGTPEGNELFPSPSRQPFVARLPQKLLSHRAGGAFAFLGLADVSWDASSLKDSLAHSLDRLMAGYPVGAATEPITARQAQLAVRLADMRSGKERIDIQSLCDTWKSWGDARAFTLLGDPAVRVPIAV